MDMSILARIFEQSCKDEKEFEFSRKDLSPPDPDQVHRSHISKTFPSLKQMNFI
jgi:hypothetical protein